MRRLLFLGFLSFYFVSTVTCRTVSESLQRDNSEKEAVLSRYRNQFAEIRDALSGSVESGEGSRTEGPSYRIDLGEALEAESFRSAAFNSDSLEFTSHEDEEEADEDDTADGGCDEGEVMKVSCNSCVCINGQFACSKKDCQQPEQPLPPKHIKTSNKKKGVMNYNKKTEQTAGVDDSTGNTLYGEYFSSEVVLGGSNSNVTIVREDPTEFSCIDGRTKPVDCNQCICALGKWACTKMSCIPMSLREKASFHGAEFIKKADTLKENMGIDEDCLEGDTKKVAGGCNQCVCHMNSWACTDFECPSVSPPVKPNAGAVKLEACQTEEDVKSVECNICSCRSGIWRCTTNDCKKFGDKYYQPVQRTPQKTAPVPLDSDSAENHSFL